MHEPIKGAKGEGSLTSSYTEALICLIEEATYRQLIVNLNYNQRP